MFINGIGTAVPEHRYSQQECWEALRVSDRFAGLGFRSQAILRKVLTGKNGIETRFLALDRLGDAFALSPNTLHERFARHAPALAGKAAAKSLSNAGLESSDIDAVLVSTCTGYLCPGLTSYIIEALNLPRGILPLDLVGQGCAAALPNLMTAETLLLSGKCRNVLSICVEVCSAAFYLDDDPGVLISACLFGDGAAAAVLGSEPGPGRRVEWKQATSRIRPEDRSFLRFEMRDGMLRNILTPEVPELAADQERELLSTALSEAGLSVPQIQGWILHPGGRDVLEAVGRQLRLEEEKLHCSYDVLRSYGNLSSPSVLFVLNEALNDSVPGGNWWMSAFGAGFSCHGALLCVD